MVELASELQTPAPRLVRPPRSKNHKIKKSLVDKPKLIDGTRPALRPPAHHNAVTMRTRCQLFAALACLLLRHPLRGRLQRCRNMVGRRSQSLACPTPTAVGVPAVMTGTRRLVWNRATLAIPQAVRPARWGGAD